MRFLFDVVLVSYAVAFVCEASAAPIRTKESQGNGARTSIGTSEKQKEATGLSGSFTASSGIGIFQDVQVPANPFFELRADGSAIGRENKNHVGVPLSIGLGLGWGRLLQMDGTFLHMASIAGPRETSSSSYQRVDTRMSHFENVGIGRGWAINGGLGLGWRRISYGNVSTAHIIEGSTLCASVDIRQGRQLGLELAGVKGLRSTARYDGGADQNRGEFDNPRVDVTEYSAGLGYRFNRVSSLNLSYSVEAVSFDVDSVYEYNRFGLYVDSFNRSESEQRVQYRLRTQIVKLSFIRNL